MSFRVRPATSDDFRPSMKWPSSPAAVSPTFRPTAARLVAKLERSEQSFAREEDGQEGDMYMFVLEDPKPAWSGNLPDLRAGRGHPAFLFLSPQHAHPDECRARQDLQQPAPVADRPRRVVRGRRAVPPPVQSGRRLGAAARPQPLPVHEIASLTVRRPDPRRASRGDGRGRHRTLLGRAGRPLLRHDLSRGRRVQCGPRDEVHRRPDAPVHRSTSRSCPRRRGA